MEQKPQETQSQMVTRLALEDLERRRQAIAPQVDDNIQEVLRICEERLKEAGEPPEPKKDAPYWDAEFNFWHKLISEEVERFRFNGGFEIIEVDLYARRAKSGPAFLGTTQIGRTRFKVAGVWGFDSEGKKILRIQVLRLQ